MKMLQSTDISIVQFLLYSLYLLVRIQYRMKIASHTGTTFATSHQKFLDSIFPKEYKHDNVVGININIIKVVTVTPSLIVHQRDLQDDFYSLFHRQPFPMLEYFHFLNRL